MRVVLLTGKGGVGKTTAAAALAAAAAGRGLRTLVLSTDGAHSLADALDAPVGDDVLAVDGLLHARHVSTGARLQASWSQVQDWLRSVCGALGVEPLEAEELTALPGGDEVAALLELRDHVRSGEWDLVVVDCAPTAETLRLLAMPEALGRLLSRLMPAERGLLRAVAPAVGRAAGVPLPGAAAVSAGERLLAEMAGVREVLAAPTSTVRLVLTPEAVVVAEARRTLTALSLHGYRVDGVVANRVFPVDGADAWRAQWVAAQARQLDEVVASFAPLPVWRAPYQPAEPRGARALMELAAETYGSDDILEVSAADGPGLEVTSRKDGWVLSMPLPLASRDDLELARSGDELSVGVAGQRRVVALPRALVDAPVLGASLVDGRLRVRFGRPREEAAR